MNVTSSPLGNATATSRGAIAPGAQELPNGPKTFQDLVTLKGAWTHTVNPGEEGSVEVSGAPLELGDFSGGTLADLETKPGLRRYTVGGNTETLLGTLNLGIRLDEDAGKIAFNGDISSASIGTLDADVAYIAGATVISSSGVATNDVSSPTGSITTLSTMSLTINGSPYVRRLIDSVDTTNGLSLSSGVLSLTEAQGSLPGAMTPNTQSFNGAKTFNAAVTMSSTLSVNLTGSFGGVVTPSVGAGANTLVLTSSLNVAAGSSRVVAVRSPYSYATLDATTRLLSVQIDGGASEIHAFTKDNLLTAGILGFSGNTAITLGMRSGVGASSGDIAVDVGSTVADGSTHASAKLFQVSSGSGANERLSTTKSFTKLTFSATNATMSTAAAGLVLNNLVGASAQSWITFQSQGVNKAGIRSDNSGTLVADATSDFYVMRSGTTQMQLGSATTTITNPWEASTWTNVVNAASTTVVNGVTFTAATTLRYRRDALGYVWTEGQLGAASSPGNGQIFFTYAAGNVPLTVQRFLLVAADGPLHCEVGTNGQVKCWTGSATPATWYSAINFAGVRFPTR